MVTITSGDDSRFGDSAEFLVAASCNVEDLLDRFSCVLGATYSVFSGNIILGDKSERVHWKRTACGIILSDRLM